MPAERISKVLAAAGVASRRGADELVAGGRVRVDGRPAVLGERVDPALQEIEVDGRPIRVVSERPIYLALHKPAGVTSTVRDRHAGTTVVDLVPPDLARGSRLYPVGRLDQDSEGLILLTNDGAFAERVSHPRYEVPRVYHAKVHRVPDPETLARLRQGVRVEGAFMAVDRVRVIEAGNNAWVEVALHEGKQHEVKRLLEAVGHPVSKLRRVSFGPVTAKGLEPGEFRPLSPGEVAGLLRGEGSRVGPVRRSTRRRPRPGTRPAEARRRFEDGAGRDAGGRSRRRPPARGGRR